MKIFPPCILVLALLGCAEVPKQSVELSTVLGKDLLETQRAHLKLVDLYYAKMESDANRFVDGVYAPYQINETLKQFQKVLTDAIANGASATSTEAERQVSFQYLEVYLTTVRANIEKFREANLAPVRAQRKLVAQKINDNYTNMSQANNAVTAYLASLVKVKDTQNEILSKLGAPNLQEQVSSTLSDASEKIDALNKEVLVDKTKVKGAIDKFELLMQSAAKP